MARVPFLRRSARSATTRRVVARVEVTNPIANGIVAGLLVGETFGIIGGAWLATRLRVASLPEGVG